MTQKTIEILSQPLNLAVVSALIGVAVLFAAEAIRNRILYKIGKKNSLNILRDELEAQKAHLVELSKMLGEGKYIHPTLDPHASKQFLVSSFVDAIKDKYLIVTLNNHIKNISTVNNAIKRADVLGAGWTSAHDDRQKQVEDALATTLPSVIKDLDGCIDAIEARVK